MPSVISGDANVSATEFGFLDGVTSGLQSQIDSKLPLAGGKILQIVRATDSTQRTTTSTTFVDASISVTITPQKSDSGILLIWSARVAPWNNTYVALRIADSSNNAISGAEDQAYGDQSSNSFNVQAVAIAYATPATTSAVTYKGRFLTTSNTGTISNQLVTGQLFAIEVSA